MRTLKYPIFFLCWLCLILLSACSGDEKKEDNLPPCQDQVAFTASEEEIFAGTEITFTNTSKDSTIKRILGGPALAEEAEESEEEEDDEEESSGSNFTWDFGDGTIDSTGRGMVPHKYEKADKYTVKLTYKGCGEVSKTITVNEIKKIADPCGKGVIKASRLKIAKGESIDFEEISGLGHQWAWHGGDIGVEMGKGQKISHMFKKTGSFKVFCTINNGAKCIEQPMVTVDVTLPVERPAIVKKVVAEAPSKKEKVLEKATAPVLPTTLDAKRIEADFNNLFTQYRKNVNLSSKFNDLCERNRFIISDKIVEYNGEMESMAAIRNEINTGASISNAKVELSSDKRKVVKISVK